MGIMAAAALGLAACGGGEESNMAIENVEDLNAADDMNMDMNAMDNVADNAMGNTTNDSATTNSY
jgi:hypothetical protein